MKNLGKITEYSKEGNTVTVIYENRKLIVTALTDEIINVFEPTWSEEHRSKAIETEDMERVTAKGAELEVKCLIMDGEKQLILTTKALKVVISEGGYVDFYKLDGTELSCEYRGERKSRKVLNMWDAELLKAEGHDVSEVSVDKPVMNVRVVDKKESFYGLGDKTGPLDKRSYEYEDWNSDIPDAHTDQFHALYKSVPFLICRKDEASYGLFYDNTFHGYFDIAKENPEYICFSADNGNLDYYFLGGDTIPAVVGNYTLLTGRAPLPQLWTLGYHQCRWGYSSAEDIRGVAEKFREYDIPCESVQYDIDYMNGYRVFTWNDKDYGPAGKLFKELGEKGFKPVVIIDPGTKREEGYFMYEEGTRNGYFFRTADNSADYVNAVWPGESNYPDFGREEVRNWWGNHLKLLTDIGIQGIWNDMNEPASFNGPLPLDVICYDGKRQTTHEELHNVYGHFMAKATYEGYKRNTGKRPLVITRAAYSGTQKYAAVWTGDNQSLWEHLRMMIPQLCNLGMSGYTIAGTDIGGFGGDTTPELLSRWIEAAAFSTFFRNHSSNGTIFQEPWQFGEEVINIYRKYVKLHYTFLPYIYDLLHEEQENGLPVMRPLVMHYEKDPIVHNMNDEFLVGEKILVAPVVNPGETVRKVYLPEGTWYSFWTGEKHEGKRFFLEEAPIDHCPIYIKGGSVIPIYDAVSYVGEKKYDRVTVVSTPEGGKMVHYQDNGEDFAYLDGEYNLYEFDVNTEGKLTAKLLHECTTVDKYDKVRLAVLS